jgi:superkiller protein 3
MTPRRPLVPLFCLALIVSLAGCTRPDRAGGESPADAAAASPAPTPAAAGDPSVFERIPAPKGLPPLDAAETAVSTKPDDGKALLTLGLVYYDARDVRDAVATLEKAAAKLPEDPTALRYLAAAYIAQGNRDGAVGALRRYANVFAVPKERRAAAQKAAGDLLWADGDLDDAAAAFRKALELDPKNGEASLALGAYAAEKKDRAGAKKYLDAAARDLPAGPPRARAYAALGLLAEQAGDKKAAAAAYKQALAQNPKEERAAAGAARLAAPKPKGG